MTKASSPYSPSLCDCGGIKLPSSPSAKNKRGEKARGERESATLHFFVFVFRGGAAKGENARRIEVTAEEGRRDAGQRGRRCNCDDADFAFCKKKADVSARGWKKKKKKKI